MLYQKWFVLLVSEKWRMILRRGIRIIETVKADIEYTRTRKATFRNSVLFVPYFCRQCQWSSCAVLIMHWEIQNERQCRYLNASLGVLKTCCTYLAAVQMWWVGRIVLWEMNARFWVWFWEVSVKNWENVEVCTVLKTIVMKLWVSWN